MFQLGCHYIARQMFVKRRGLSGQGEVHVKFRPLLFESIKGRILVTKYLTGISILVPN